MNLHTNITNLKLIGGSTKVIIPQGYNNDSSSSSLDFQIQNINKFISKSGLKDNLTKQSSKIKILEVFYLYLQQINRTNTKNTSFSPIKKKINKNTKENAKNLNNYVDTKSIPNLELDKIYQKKCSIIEDDNLNSQNENVKQDSKIKKEQFLSKSSKKQNKPINNLKTLNNRNDLNNSIKTINAKENTKHLLMSPNQSKSKFCLNLSSQSPIQISDEFLDDVVHNDQNINKNTQQYKENSPKKSSYERDNKNSIDDKKLDKLNSNTDQEKIKYKDFSPEKNNLSTKTYNLDDHDKIVGFSQNEQDNINNDNLQYNKKNNPCIIDKNPSIKRLSTIKKDSAIHYLEHQNDNFDLDNTISTDQNIEEMNHNQKTILDKNDGVIKICNKNIEGQKDYTNSQNNKFKSNSKLDIEKDYDKLYSKSVDNYIEKGKNMKELYSEFNEDMNSKTMRSSQFSGSLHNKINHLKNKFGSVYSSVSKTERTPKNLVYSKSLVNNPKGKKLEFNSKINQNSKTTDDNLQTFEIELKQSKKLTDAAEQLNQYNEMLALQEMRKKESMLRFQIYENDSTANVSNSMNNINIKINNKNSQHQNTYKKLSNQISNDIKSNDITSKSITSEAYRENIISIKEVFDEYGKGIMKEPDTFDSVENINDSRKQSTKKQSNQNQNNQSNLIDQVNVDVVENKKYNFELMDENEKDNQDDDYMTFNEQSQVTEKEDNEQFNKRKTLKEKLLKKDSNQEDNKNKNLKAIKLKKSGLDKKQNKNDNRQDDNSKLNDNLDLKLIKRQDSYDINETLNKNTHQQSQSFKDSFDNIKKINTDRTNQSLINQKSQIHSFIKEYKNKNFSPKMQRSHEDFKTNTVNENQDIDAENILQNQININLEKNNNNYNDDSKTSNSITKEFSPFSTDSKLIELNSQDPKSKSKINLKDDFLSNINNSKTKTEQNPIIEINSENIINNNENNDKVFNQIFGNSDKKPSKTENYNSPESPKQNILISNYDEIKPKNLNTQLNLNINLSNFDKSQSPATIEIQRNNLEVINIEFTGDKLLNGKSKINTNSVNKKNLPSKVIKNENDSNQIHEIDTGSKKIENLLSLNNPIVKNNSLFNNPKVTMIDNNVDKIPKNLQNSQDSKDSDNTINSSHQNDSLINSKLKNADYTIENSNNQTLSKSNIISSPNNDSLLNTKIKNTDLIIEKPIKNTSSINKSPKNTSSINKSPKNKSPNIIIDSNINIFDNLSKNNIEQTHDDKITDNFTNDKNLVDSFDINSLNNLNSFVLSSEKAIELKLLIQELKTKFITNNSCQEDIYNQSKQTLQIICDYVQKSLIMQENLTKKYQDSGKIITNNKIILFHYLKYMYKYNNDLLDNRTFINQSKSDTIKSIYSRYKKEIDDIDFDEKHFQEKLRNEELIASIDMHTDIVHNNEINIGLLKTRIKHMWDYVGCCNECMLIIDKLCCRLDVYNNKDIQSQGSLKMNDREKLSNQDIKKLLNDLDGKINQLDNLKI